MEDDLDPEEGKRRYEQMLEHPANVTEGAVSAVLKEMDQAKKAKRDRREGVALLGESKHKGKNMEEDPEKDQETNEGPIMEGMVEVAAEKRSIQRLERRKQAETNMRLSEDTSMQLGDNVKDAEETFEAPDDEEAELFEPFNLDNEREQGYFDAEGNYVEYKEEKHSADAWLTDVKVDTAHAKKAQEAADAKEPEPLGEVGIARLKKKIAAILQPGETVLRALKRLGTKQSLADASSKAQFEELTECASDLMANGEYEVYSDTKRVFERDAALYETAPVEASAPPADDMFADSDDDAPPAAPPAPAPQAEQVSAPAVVPAVEVDESSRSVPDTQQLAPAEDTTDYASWPVGELRRFLTENGEDAEGIVEKDDMVSRVIKTAKRLRVETTWDPAAGGYNYHPPSGMYLNSESGLYFDPDTAGFYNKEDGKWYSFDSVQQSYIEWDEAKQAAAVKPC
mmetsp:Transcript_9552/g.17995  ORF Transcript_9552/g.17995 Transcript_9552/m.17995 type:complete len:455 (-) Transcript_9552:299-1663(-)|eukprot:CAMPEP_0114238238 /NCGR_PEP_ID=MMETSP0058-20121206/7819_1 /TAXON_ID=36894 /ORGANISM="Pyramimonas parkeae, CCMP726" /LENGTH=454 /DNA_ID=CAMNT_0001350337 /DNA_START=108 /DNA_END=1472 /DNA_ORIENTATION=+